MQFYKLYVKNLFEYKHPQQQLQTMFTSIVPN
jgi:hypothetical protein